ncbi:hypothetical protein EVAR_60683_1 [Eumeta japonica]|uniref:Uncharacterized protein n=1 Tax=Eumeta variegata TaxID=151549 RepID=A0A4C1ZWK7_EUMVA|nr:hypothetical protein EVAR_60683_1 [Eumeta japonica]
MPERELSLRVGVLALWIYILEWDMRSRGAKLRFLLLSIRGCQAETSEDAGTFRSPFSTTVMTWLVKVGSKVTGAAAGDGGRDYGIVHDTSESTIRGFHISGELLRTAMERATIVEGCTTSSSVRPVRDGTLLEQSFSSTLRHARAVPQLGDLELETTENSHHRLDIVSKRWGPAVMVAGCVPGSASGRLLERLLDDPRVWFLPTG